MMIQNARTFAKFGLLATAASLTIGIPSAALAQAADETAGVVDQEGDIIVTARKREESLQDVPIAVTAISGDRIESQGLRNVSDLYGRVPSLFFSVNRQFSSGKDNTFLVLRGVGANPALEPSVGIFIDGIYQPSLGFETSFLDVERIELLRGPQGALFGRSTEGGALNIVTRKPGPEFRATANLRVDDLPSIYGTTGLSGPISDNLFVGVSVQGYGTDGYVYNRYTRGQQNSDGGGSARFALRYDSGGATEINLSVDGTFKRGTELSGGIPLDFGSRSYEVDFDYGGDFSSNEGGIGLVVDHDFSFAQLTSLTGYRVVTSHRGTDFDANNLLIGNVQFIDGKQKVLSQELRLQSNAPGPFSWLAGVYLFDQSDRNHLHTDWATYFGSPPASADIIVPIDRQGYALFGSVNYNNIAGFLDLSAGIRYSAERVKATKFNYLTIPSFGLDITIDLDRKTRFNDVSPNFQAVAHLTRDINVYANISKGFKSGGFEKYPTTTNPFLPLEPETAWNYELGTKGRVAGGLLTWAIAAYRIDIKNQHIPTLVPDPNTGFNRTAIASAGSAHTEGVEVEATLAPVQGLNIRGSLAYTKAQFDDFIDPTNTQRAGDPIPNVPRWIYSIGANYRTIISDKVSLVTNVDMRHISTYFSGIGTNADSLRPYPPYNIWDADLSLEFDRFTVGIFARNLTNEYVILSQGFSADRGDLLRQVGPPRVFGARVSYKWGE